MKKKIDYSKVINVWKSENKIIIPNDKKLLFDIVDKVASLFSSGSFYYFVTNFVSFKIEFVSDAVRDVLGIEPDQFSLENFFGLLHPEDLAKIHQKESTALNFFKSNIATEDIPLYKVVYLFRLRTVNGDYKTILHQANAINMSKGGKIQQALGVHTDVTYLNIPIDHKISLISTQRPSYYSLETDDSFQLIDNSFKTIFTKREKEIIRKLSEGKDYHEIAELLFLSPHTINTHKKNILMKSGCNNITEVVAKCIIESVI